MATTLWLWRIKYQQRVESDSEGYYPREYGASATVVAGEDGADAWAKFKAERLAFGWEDEETLVRWRVVRVTLTGLERLHPIDVP